MFPVSVTFRGPKLTLFFYVEGMGTSAPSLLLIVREGSGLSVTLKQASTKDSGTPIKLFDFLKFVEELNKQTIVNRLLTIK